MIPNGSIEIQEGLWLYEYSKEIAGQERTFRKLYASEGYCFCFIPNNLDEEGNLLPEYERQYATYMTCSYSDVAEINENFISVERKPEYEIV